MSVEKFREDSMFVKVDEFKQKLVDKISDDLGLVLGDTDEIKQMLYLAYMIGSHVHPNDDDDYDDAVDKSIEFFQQKHKI